VSPAPAIGQRWKNKRGTAIVEIVAAGGTHRVLTLVAGKSDWFEFKIGERYSFDNERFTDNPSPRYQDITFEYLDGQDAPSTR
jgi:hypothetical protein